MGLCTHGEREGCCPHCDLAARDAEIERLKNVLRKIAAKGWRGDRFEGYCPGDCASPHIANEALAEGERWRRR